ncbi:MAG: hypothetical protein ACOX8W_12305 [bacterium]
MLCAVRLTDLPKTRTGFGYRLGGKFFLNSLVTLTELARCEPAYEKTDVWDEDITEIHSDGDLPISG